MESSIIGSRLLWDEGVEPRLLWGVGSASNGCMMTDDREYDYKILTPLKEYHTYKQISCGTKHCMAQTLDNCLYQWGEHISVGTNGKELISSVPIHIMLKDKVTAVSCGFEHTLLLTESSCVFGLGRNNQGQLG